MEDKGRCKSPSSAEERRKASRCRQLIVKTEGRSVQSRIVCPALVDRVRHMTRGPSTVHYMSAGPDDPVEPQNPYKLTELPRRTRSSGYAYPTYKWRGAAGLRARLRVVGDEELPQEKRRPLPELNRTRGKFVRHKYIEELKKRTVTNILTGYIADEIKMKEENATIVQFSLEEAQKEIDKASKSMAEFLSGEQKNCENLTKKLNEVLEAKSKRENQIESEKKKMSEVKLRIFHLNEYLERMKKCREFVLNVAPEDWKKNYEKETESRQEEVKPELFKLRKAIRNYKTNCAGEDLGLEKVLEDFITEYSTAGPPSLPYDDPHRIFRLFKNLEFKSLLGLHHNEELKKALEKAKNISDYCDNAFEEKKERIEDSLKNIKEAIDKEKKIIEEKQEILNNLKEGPYRNLIASEEVLLEHMLIKDVYDELIGNPKKDLDSLEMIQEIGELFYDLNRRLEKLPPSYKMSLKKQVREALENGMKEAERGERRKKQIECMLGGLRRAREKPWVRTGRPLLFKSSPSEVPHAADSRVKDVSDEGHLVLREDLETDFQLVYSSNHPGPGPYCKPSPKPRSLVQYKKFYPDLNIADTDEDIPLISESEEEKEGKKKIDPTEEKKKVKRKKHIIILDSDESD